MISQIKKNKIGFMQGRMVSCVKNRIQYFPDKDWINELKIAKKNKFKIIEWSINSENIKKNPFYNGDLEIIKKSLKDNNIRCNSVTCDFFMQKPFFKKKFKFKKNLLISDLLKVIDNAKKLNLMYIIIPLVDQSSIKNKKEEKCLIDNFKKMILPKLGKLCILFEIDYKPGDIMNFIKQFKSKKFGINYDTGNSAGLNFDTKDEFKYFSFVKNIHVKDRKKYGKTVDLGKGNWNFGLFFKKLKKTNYTGNLILQTARAKDGNHVKKILENRNFLYKYI